MNECGISTCVYAVAGKHFSTYGLHAFYVVTIYYRDVTNIAVGRRPYRTDPLLKLLTEQLKKGSSDGTIRLLCQ